MKSFPRRFGGSFRFAAQFAVAPLVALAISSAGARASEPQLPVPQLQTQIDWENLRARFEKLVNKLPHVVYEDGHPRLRYSSSQQNSSMPSEQLIETILKDSDKDLKARLEMYRQASHPKSAVFEHIELHKFRLNPAHLKRLRERILKENNDPQLKAVFDQVELAEQKAGLLPPRTVTIPSNAAALRRYREVHGTQEILAPQFGTSVTDSGDPKRIPILSDDFEKQIEKFVAASKFDAPPSKPVGAWITVHQIPKKPIDLDKLDEAGFEALAKSYHHSGKLPDPKFKPVTCRGFVDELLKSKGLTQNELAKNGIDTIIDEESSKSTSFPRVLIAPRRSTENFLVRTSTYSSSLGLSEKPKWQVSFQPKPGKIIDYILSKQENGTSCGIEKIVFHESRGRAAEYSADDCKKAILSKNASLQTAKKTAHPHNEKIARFFADFFHDSGEACANALPYFADFNPANKHQILSADEAKALKRAPSSDPIGPASGSALIKVQW